MTGGAASREVAGIAVTERGARSEDDDGGRESPADRGRDHPLRVKSGTTIHLGEDFDPRYKASFAVKWSVIPAGLLVLSTELDFLQNGLLARSLTGLQWLACIDLALAMPIVVEIDKWVHRRRQRPPGPVEVEAAVAPARATVAA